MGSSELLEIWGWKLTREAALHRRATNATGGYKRTVAGTKSGSGTIEGDYDPAAPVEDHIREGDSVTLKLYTTATKFYLVPALIENIELTVDLDEGEIVAWTASFMTNGAWTEPT